MGDNAILVRLFRHNLWANEEMVRACAPLTEGQLETEIVGTYGRLSSTLIHLARAQGGYVRTLTAWEPGDEHRLEYDAAFPGVEVIVAHLRFTGERLVEVAKTARTDRTLEGMRSGEAYRLPEWVVLLQAAQHATEHRQQIATALTTLGLEPPEPDLWAYWSAVDAGEA